jgi:hypothetical protein
MNAQEAYIAWANLVDMGFEFSLANLRARYGQKRAFSELRASLRRQSEAHHRDLISMLKRLK